MCNCKESILLDLNYNPKIKVYYCPIHDEIYEVPVQGSEERCDDEFMVYVNIEDINDHCTCGNMCGNCIGEDCGCDCGEEDHVDCGNCRECGDSALEDEDFNDDYCGGYDECYCGDNYGCDGKCDYCYDDSCYYSQSERDEDADDSEVAFMVKAIAVTAAVVLLVILVISWG